MCSALPTIEWNIVLHKLESFGQIAQLGYLLVLINVSLHAYLWDRSDVHIPSYWLNSENSL